ncbi:MAG: trehalose-phosphatase [Myxococcota bacterium]|nr:trehalose-phosphatase [Myxococcota bacterium]
MDDGRPLDALPRALDRLDEIAERVGTRRAAFFLDYDGTLSPIVEHPEDAELPEAMRDLLARLGVRHLVAIVSGRDLRDLRARVGLDGIVYAGSHGFEIRDADGEVHVHEPARRALPELDRAQERLEEALAPEDGVELERKGFGLAVHFRRAAPDREPALREQVQRACRESEALRMTEGRKVLELRPDVPWDKGRALDHILERTGADDERVCPVYVGDDVTDEDAFRVVEAGGVGVLVRGRQGDATHARWALEDPEAVRRFLAALADRLGGDATPQGAPAADR